MFKFKKFHLVFFALLLNAPVLGSTSELEANSSGCALDVSWHEMKLAARHSVQFEIHPLFRRGEVFSEIVGEIGQWLERKLAYSHPNFVSLLIDGTSIHELPNGARFETRSDFTTSDVTPDRWALRYESKKEKGSRRDEIAIHWFRSRYYITLSQSVFRSEDSDRREDLFAYDFRFRERIVRLIQNRNWPIFAGLTELKPTFQKIEPRNAEDLVTMIRDPLRGLPLVYICEAEEAPLTSEESEDSPMEKKKLDVLAAELNGQALLFYGPPPNRAPFMGLRPFVYPKKGTVTIYRGGDIHRFNSEGTFKGDSGNGATLRKIKEYLGTASKIWPYNDSSVYFTNFDELMPGSGSSR